MATTPQSLSGEIEKANTILGAANQIWLAGLGAFAVAQREGGKMFEALIQEGEEFEQRTVKMASQKVEEVRDKVEEVRDKASEQLDRLEQAFQNRVSRALNRLGVPTSEDIQELMKRVEALNANINKLSRGEPVVASEKRKTLEVTS